MYRKIVMSRQEEIIARIVGIADSKYPNSEVFLFGSRARGDNNSISDWDLLFLLDQNTVPFDLETALMDDMYELELETNNVISPIIYSKNEWKNKYASTQLFENIRQDGIRIK